MNRRKMMTGVAMAAAMMLMTMATGLVGHAADDDAGWVNLFDGKTTDGWTPRGKVETFEATGGELHLLSKGNVWVTTDVKMKDFEVEAEVLTPDAKGFNSGLAFRCQGETGKPKGYQCEIENGDEKNQTGGVYGIGLGGWLYPGKGDDAFYEKTRGLFKPSEWNRVKVRCVGPRIQTWVNGVAVADIEDDKQLEGYFGIQHHGGGAGVVKFRNIRAREIK